MVPNYRCTVTLEWDIWADSLESALQYLREDAYHASYMVGGVIASTEIEPLATNQESTAPAVTSAH